MARYDNLYCGAALQSALTGSCCCCPGPFPTGPMPPGEIPNGDEADPGPAAVEVPKILNYSEWVAGFLPIQEPYILRPEAQEFIFPETPLLVDQINGILCIHWNFFERTWGDVDTHPWMSMSKSTPYARPVRSKELDLSALRNQEIARTSAVPPDTIHGQRRNDSTGLNLVTQHGGTCSLTLDMGFYMGSGLFCTLDMPHESHAMQGEISMLEDIPSRHVYTCDEHGKCSVSYRYQTLEPEPESVLTWLCVPYVPNDPKCWYHSLPGSEFQNVRKSFTWSYPQYFPA